MPKRQGMGNTSSFLTESELPMLLAHHGRRFVGILAALASCSSGASAWEYGCGDSKTVKLPPQRVTLVAGDTHFSAKDRGGSRTVGVVPMLYMPMQMPMVGFGFPAGLGGSSGTDDTLSKALEASQHEMRAKSAYAAFEAEVNHKSALMQKLRAGTSAAADTSKTDLQAQQIQQIANTLQKLDERLTAVEKLLIVHDNYLKDKVEKEDAGSAPNSNKSTQKAEKLGPPTLPKPIYPKE